MSAGMISAASACPERTFCSASARLWTTIGSMAVKNLPAYWRPSTLVDPRLNEPWPAGTSFRNATLGLVGPRESA